jgi:hypothetical protein
MDKSYLTFNLNLIKTYFKISVKKEKSLNLKSEIGSKKGLFKEQKMGYFRKTNFHQMGEIIFQPK